MSSVPSDGASLPRVALRALKRFHAHEMTDHAAALTYYAMMSLFPALLASVSLSRPGRRQSGSSPTRSTTSRDQGADASTADAIAERRWSRIVKAGGAASASRSSSRSLSR